MKNGAFSETEFNFRDNLFIYLFIYLIICLFIYLLSVCQIFSEISGVVFSKKYEWLLVFVAQYKL